MYNSREHEFYSILQVKEGSSIEEIHRQYACLSNLYHPAKNPGEEKWCHMLQAKLDDAYEYLKLKHAGVRCDHLLALSPNTKNQDEARRTYEPWRPDVPFDVASPHDIPKYAAVQEEERLARKHRSEITRQISVVCASIVIGAVSIWGIFAFKQNANASDTSVSRSIAVNNHNSSSRLYHLRKDTNTPGNRHHRRH